MIVFFWWRISLSCVATHESYGCKVYFKILYRKKGKIPWHWYHGSNHKSLTFRFMYWIFFPPGWLKEDAKNWNWHFWVFLNSSVRFMWGTRFKKHQKSTEDYQKYWDLMTNLWFYLWLFERCKVFFVNRYIHMYLITFLSQIYKCFSFPVSPISNIGVVQKPSYPKLYNCSMISVWAMEQFVNWLN